MNLIKKVIVSSLSLLFAANLHARIMDDDEAKLADTSLLKTEANMFQNIRMGMALSFASCEGDELCELSVNSDEVQRLINKLNSRISDLTLRQESVDDPLEFDQVLSVYVDERDNYSELLQRLGTVEDDIEEIASEEDLDISEPDLEDTLADEPVVVEESTDVVIEETESFDIFEDADLDLQDDEDLEDFEDDFDPSQY